MTICRFFLQGRCKFGNSCRFEHADPESESGNQYDSRRDYGYDRNYRDYSRDNRHVQHSNSATANSPSFNEIISNLKQEIENCERGKQWLFSCFSPFKDGCNYPGFVDTSPEEMRFTAYNCQLQNNLHPYLQNVQQMRDEIHGLRQQLKNPNAEILQILLKMHGASLVQAVNPFQNEQSYGVGQRNVPFGRVAPSNFKFDLSRLDSAPTQATTGNFGFFTGTGNNNQTNMATNSFASSKIGFGSSVATRGPMFSRFAPQAATTTEPAPTFGSGSGFVQSNVFATHENNQLPRTGIFGAPQNVTQSNVFCAPQTLVPDEGCQYSERLFSPLENLSSDEKSEFTNPKFTFGCVPTVPPPQEMCF